MRTRITLLTIAFAALLGSGTEARAEDVGSASQTCGPQGAHRVVLYGTPWCGWCARARRYLTDRNVPFEDVDVEANAEGARRLSQLARRVGLRPGSVPVLEVDGVVVAGFNKQRLDSLLGVP